MPENPIPFSRRPYKHNQPHADINGSDAVWACDDARLVPQWHLKIPLAVLVIFLIAFAGRAQAQPERDPCRLLSDAGIRVTQGHAPAQKIPSEQPAGSFRFTLNPSDKETLSFQHLQTT